MDGVNCIGLTPASDKFESACILKPHGFTVKASEGE
jgi:hypothetical protein